jgi:hypothetical protein
VNGGSVYILRRILQATERARREGRTTNIIKREKGERIKDAKKRRKEVKKGKTSK